MLVKSPRSTLLKVSCAALLLTAVVSLTIACGSGGVEAATMVRTNTGAGPLQGYQVFIEGSNEEYGASAFLTIHGDAVRLLPSGSRAGTECGDNASAKVYNNQKLTFATCQPGAASDVTLSWEGKEYFRTTVTTPELASSPPPTAAPVLPPASTPTPADTGAWTAWDELEKEYGSGTGPHVFLEATDPTGTRLYGLQVVCWPTSPDALEDRRLGVMVAETFLDTDLIAAMKAVSATPGHYPVEVAMDGESLGQHGWLLEYEEGPLDAYFYAELFTATQEVSEEIVGILATPGATQMVVNIIASEDAQMTRVFDVAGADEVLKPVLEACRE